MRLLEALPFSASLPFPSSVIIKSNIQARQGGIVDKRRSCCGCVPSSSVPQSPTSSHSSLLYRVFLDSKIHHTSPSITHLLTGRQRWAVSGVSALLQEPSLASIPIARSKAANSPHCLPHKVSTPSLDRAPLQFEVVLRAAFICPPTHPTHLLHRSRC